MTGQPAVIRTEATHIMSLVDKVVALLETGDIWSIVDPRLNESIHNQNSIWRAIDAAIACVQKNSVERPAMSPVVTELKECLAMEMDARKSQGNHTFKTVEISPRLPLVGMDPAAK